MEKADIKLSQVEIIPVRPQKGLVAFCSFVINDAFCVNGVGIRARMDGSGYRLTYPLRILPNGKEIGLFCPANREVTEVIESQVIKAFLELQAKAVAMRHEGND